MLVACVLHSTLLPLFPVTCAHSSSQASEEKLQQELETLRTEKGTVEQQLKEAESDVTRLKVGLLLGCRSSLGTLCGRVCVCVCL